MNRIVTIGYVWKSQQNGAVYDVGGGIPLPCLRSALRRRTEDNGSGI